MSEKLKLMNTGDEFMQNNASEMILQLLYCFLESDLPWMKLVAHQINTASWTAQNLQSSYFVDFHCPSNAAARIPSSAEVPVEIIFGQVRVDPGAVVGTIAKYPVVISNKEMTFEISDPDAFAVRLHFRNGIIFELEAYSIDGNTLDLSGLAGKDRVYVLDGDVWFM